LERDHPLELVLHLFDLLDLFIRDLDKDLVFSLCSLGLIVNLVWQSIRRIRNLDCFVSCFQFRDYFFVDYVFLVVIPFNLWCFLRVCCNTVLENKTIYRLLMASLAWFKIVDFW
jgi:hypothetical protein